MKWAILATLVLAQDKTPLSWKLQAKDTLIVKSSFTQSAGDSKWEYSFETEIQVVHVDGEGAKVIVRVLKATGQAPDAGYAFERGKSTTPEILAKEHSAQLTPAGRLIPDSRDKAARTAAQSTLGYLYGTVPVKNVSDGESWRTEEKFMLPGPDAGLFLTHTHEKGGRILIVGAGEGLDGEKLEGKGEMLFEKGAMKRYSFKVEERGNGKLLNSAEQRVEIELKR
jgi:hypothetical protein